MSEHADTATTQRVVFGTDAFDLELVAAEEMDRQAASSDPEAHACQVPPIVLLDPYRVGRRNGSREHWAHRFHVDRWFRSWQCEWQLIYGTVADNCMSAPRAWTRRGVLRKARRWFRTGRDVGRHRTGRPWGGASRSGDQ